MVRSRTLRRGLLLAALLSASLAGAPVFAQDMDGDGVPDVDDFCSADPQAPFPCGLDTDHDGYGNRCDADFNNDGVVNAKDGELLIADLRTGLDSGVGTDMNCDGVAASTDASLFLNQMNGRGAPGPSGLPCAGTVPCP